MDSGTGNALRDRPALGGADNAAYGPHVQVVNFLQTVLSQPALRENAAMTDSCILVSVVRDFRMYEKCVQGNPFVSDCTKHPIDNRSENNAISLCYNRFLDAFDYTRPAWFVFCHEDFQMSESSEKSPYCPTPDNKPRTFIKKGTSRRGMQRTII